IGHLLNEIRKNKGIKLSSLLDFIHVSNSAWYRYVKGETDITTLQFLDAVRYLRTTFSEVAHMKTMVDKNLQLYESTTTLPALITYDIPLTEFYLTHNIERLKSAVRLYRMTSKNAFNYDIPGDLRYALKSVLLEGEYGLEEVNLLVLLKLKFDNVIFKESEFINVLHNLLATLKKSINDSNSFGDLSASQQSIIYFNQSLGLRFAFGALSSITSAKKAQQYVPLLFQVIQLNTRACYTPLSLYNFASQKIITIGEQYLLNLPIYQSMYAEFRQAVLTLYPEPHRANLESLNYDLLKKDLFETTISPEMKKAYQHYADKL
ncbi:helix-turn-helix domain-containing protein, partial [Leuconostoc inhae]|uniref:helix-turn-helix domain-containing protein n=1 Tax=Leuconostoc inhae TaxID=178001 RepID=UPI001FEAFA81